MSEKQQSFGSPVPTQPAAPAANTPATAGQTTLPAFLQGEETGTEFMDQEDTIVPRVKICQAMSQSIKEDVPSIRDGDFYHNISKQILGQAMYVYVLFHWRSEVWFNSERKLIGTRFRNPFNKEQWFEYGKEIDAIIKDLDQPEEKRLYPKPTENHNYMLAMGSSISQMQMPEIFIYSAGSAACKPAKEFNSQLKYEGRMGVPIWAHQVKVQSAPVVFPKGTAFMPKFDIVGRVETSDQAVLLKKLYTEAKRLVTNEDNHIKAADDTDVVEEEPPTQPGPPPQGGDIPF